MTARDKEQVGRLLTLWLFGMMLVPLLSLLFYGYLVTRAAVFVGTIFTGIFVVGWIKRPWNDPPRDPR